MEALLPDWAPNIHPLLIHFPIALWTVAMLFDFLSLFKSEGWFRNASVALYGLGALSSLAAFFSGKQAIDIVSVPFQGELTASNHSDWGHYTIYFFVGYALIRCFFLWKKMDTRKPIAILLLLLGMAGMSMVAKTADMGGKLVYKYGVGVNK